MHDAQVDAAATEDQLCAAWSVTDISSRMPRTSGGGSAAAAAAALSSAETDAAAAMTAGSAEEPFGRDSEVDRNGLAAGAARARAGIVPPQKR